MKLKIHIFMNKIKILGLIVITFTIGGCSKNESDTSLSISSDTLLNNEINIECLENNDSIDNIGNEDFNIDSDETDVNNTNSIIQDEEQNNKEDEENIVQREDVLPYENEGFIVFGAYEQDGDLTNGTEPIEWEILDSNENGTLLISRYILDVQPYDDEGDDVGWEECSLRKWLNGDFINSAFTKNEQDLINITNIVNSDDPWIYCNRRATQDKIFCLSLFEIKKYYDYKIAPNKCIYYASQKLIVSPTFYAIDQGIYHRSLSSEEYYEYDYTSRYSYTTDCIEKEGGEWWLRTPSRGVPFPMACIIHTDGTFGEDTDRVLDDEEIGVRPAMYIEY